MTLIKSLVVSLALGASALAQAAEPIIIKLSHVVATGTAKGQGAEYFKKQAEERTKGRVRVEVYANSSLYKDKEELEALQMGSVQMLIPSLSKFGPLGAKEFEVFDLPYLFGSYKDVHKVTDGPIGKQLLGKLEVRGLKGLAYWDNGFKIFSSNRPITAPTEVKGQKIRIQSSKVLELEIRTLNALPQTMPFSEVYQAMQTGVVDGAEQTPTQSYSQRFYEVQKYYVTTNHGYLGYAVIANKKFWDGLPADVRGLLEEAMRDTTEYVNRLTVKENEDDLKRIASSGKSTVIDLTPVQRDAWRKALAPVTTEAESRIPKSLIEAIQKEVAAK